MTEDLIQYIPGQEHSQVPPSVSENEKSNPFVCNVCKQNYSRVDHLARHYRSHTREKPFSCSTCGKNFARADLLKRHATSHSSDKKDIKKNHLASTHLTRVAQACSSCASAKLRCGHEKPCRRCLQKGIPCTFPPSHGKHGSRSQSSQSSNTTIKPTSQTVQSDTLQSPDVPMAASPAESYQYPDPQQQNLPMQIPGTNTFSQGPRSMPRSHPTDPINDSTMPMSSGNLNEDAMLDMDDSSLADFLRDVMMPATPNSLEDPTQMDFMPQAYSSRDVFNFGIDSSLEFNDMDFGWMSSHNSWDPMMNLNTLPEYSEPPAVDHGQKVPDVPDTISLGAEAFQKSLWNWLPEQREHGFNEVSNLSLPHTDMESLEGRGPTEMHDRLLDQSSRDGILTMLLTTYSHGSNMPRVVTSFPSTRLLDSLMHVFVRSETLKTDSWIHFPTYRPQNSRPELNGIVVAAGAILSPVPTVRKLGFAIQEAVRLAVVKIFENDNSKTRELQSLQCYALELSIGLWSGNKRKMEIAESHAQPLITMLRRGGHYRRSRNPPPAPEAEDDDRTLENKWRAWVEVESFKRLAFHTLIHDAQASLSLLVRPLVSYAEVSLELPCHLSLWRAKSAQAWREIYLQNPGHSTRLPSLMNCVHDLQALAKVQDTIDLQHSTSIILHAIWSLIAEYRQLEFVLKLQSPERHWNGGLISTSWHQELCQLIDYFRNTISEWPGGIRPEQKMIQELYMMNLHVSFEELQLFAGKEGNEEAQRVYPLLKVWFENRKSRQAVWHAGQVIRAALLFPLNQLRDFYAVALYHASLALWVYGMVSLGSSRNGTHRGTNVDSITEDEFIYLDGEDTVEARRFIAISRGVPVIQELPSRNGEQQAPGFARLDNPQAVMEIVFNILTRNCTSGHSGTAPLVENLSQLVLDLGNAARIVGR